MSHKRMEFDRVRRAGLALPEVEESTTYGEPSLKRRGRMFACMASHRSAEPDTLVVRLPIEQRDAMVAERPDLYYVTPHYVAYPSVLVRLARVTPEELHGLLQQAWRFVGGKGR